jgi:hypothetical protein
MEVKDFFTYYPKYNPKFEREIFHLKEFYDERMTDDYQTPSEGLWNHQKVLSRFMNKHTPYRSLLLVHQVGTGKTCAAFAIAEANLSSAFKRTIFISPSQDLNKQQKHVLITKCFPKKYGKLANKKIRRSSIPYEFKTPQTFANYVERMDINKIRKFFANTLFIIDEVHKIKQYENVTVKKEEIAKLKEQLKTLSGNSALKLKEEISNIEKKTIQAYTQLQKVLKNAYNTKVLLLTATPMVDRGSEITGVLNLLLPYKDRLKRDDWKNKNKLAKTIRGRVSYLKSKELTTGKNFIQEFYKNIDEQGAQYFPKKMVKTVRNLNLNLVTCAMSDLQTEVYLKTWCEAIFRAQDNKWLEPVPSLCQQITPPKKQKTLAYNAEQASLLITGPNGTIPTNKVLFGSKIKQKNKFFRNIASAARKTNKTFEQVLYNYAPKYAVTFKKLKEAYKNKKKSFIYIRSVTGGGANALKMLLMENGYIDYTYRKESYVFGGKTKLRKVAIKKLPSTKLKRFVFLTGDTSVDKSKVIDIFNDPKNAQGEYISIIIGTDTITQGFTIKDVQEMHVHDPPWNLPTLEQAIGRIIRENSHSVINKILNTQVNVNIYLYSAVPNLSSDVGKKFYEEQQKLSSEYNFWNSIDLKRFTKMTEKDFEIKSVERTLMENAFDCALFYNRNNRKSSDDNSRDCEYNICDYNCTGIDKEYLTGEKTPNVNANNYVLLYEDENIQKLTPLLVEKILPNVNITSIPLLQKYLKEELNLDIISRTIMIVLNYIIQNKVPIINNDISFEGLKMYLYECNDLYYISTPENSEFTGSLSPNFMFQQKTSDNYIDNIGNTISSDIFCEGNKKKIELMLKYEKPLIKELITEHSILAEERNINSQNNLSSIVLSSKSIEPFVYQSNDGTTVISKIIPDCKRELKLPLQENKKGKFCGKKVNWAPEYWNDAAKNKTKSLDDAIMNVLKRSIQQKIPIIGIGSNNDLIILMTDVIYPIVNGSRDLNGLPSNKNLPKKKDGTIDTRKVPSGIMATSLSAAKKFKILTELFGITPVNKKQNYLQPLLETTLKSNNLWISETNADLSGRAKTDVIKLYETVL